MVVDTYSPIESSRRCHSSPTIHPILIPSLTSRNHLQSFPNTDSSAGSRGMPASTSMDTILNKTDLLDCQTTLSEHLAIPILFRKQARDEDSSPLLDPELARSAIGCLVFYERHGAGADDMDCKMSMTDAQAFKVASFKNVRQKRKNGISDGIGTQALMGAAVRPQRDQ